MIINSFIFIKLSDAPQLLVVTYFNLYVLQVSIQLALLHEVVAHLALLQLRFHLSVHEELASY